MDKLHSLGFLLNRASFSLAKALRYEFKKNNIDLPHSQFVVLRCLYYKDGISQYELSTLLSKDASAIKRTIDNLEKKGLAKREQVSSRQNSIHITPKGKELMPVALQYAEVAADKVLGTIDELDIETLKDCLNEIYVNVENL